MRGGRGGGRGGKRTRPVIRMLNTAGDPEASQLQYFSKNNSRTPPELFPERELAKELGHIEPLTEEQSALVETQRQIQDFYRFSGYYMGDGKKKGAPLERYSDKYRRIELLRNFHHEIKHLSPLVFPAELRDIKSGPRSVFEPDVQQAMSSARITAQLHKASQMDERRAKSRRTRGARRGESSDDEDMDAEDEDEDDRLERLGLEEEEEEEEIEEEDNDYGQNYNDDDEDGADAFGKDEGETM